MPNSVTPPVSNFNDVLAVASERGAAEVHFVVGSPPFMRLADELAPINGFPALTSEQAEATISSFLSAEEQARLHAEKEISGARISDNGLRWRYHIFYQKNLPSFSVHLVPKNLPTVESLHLPKNIEMLGQIPRGLVIITGPYGSGRSSTIAALINAINQTRAARILTLESLLEFIFTSAKSIVEQREIGRDAQSYEAALRKISEEDVGVIMVSEVANAEVASLVMGLASSRLVFIILSENTSIKAIEHLMSLYSDSDETLVRSALSDALAGVICQRVLPRSGGGQVMVAEVLLGTPSIKTIIRDGKIVQLNNLLQTSRAEGMISLDQALAEAVRAGEISAEVAEREAVDAHYLQSLFKREA